MLRLLIARMPNGARFRLSLAVLYWRAGRRRNALECALGKEM